MDLQRVRAGGVDATTCRNVRDGIGVHCMNPQDQERSNGGLLPAKRLAGEVIREEFGADQIERRGETASVAIAAREKAAVEARYVVAMRNPRDVDNFRVRLLKECR